MRRLTLVFLLLLIALLGVTGGAWLFRKDIAEIAAQQWLATRDVPVELAVTRLELDGLTVTGLTLGSQPVVSAREVELQLAWPRWRAPEIAGLRVDSGRLHLDLTGDAPVLGELQPLFDGIETEATAPSQAPAPTAQRGASSESAPFSEALTGPLPSLPFPVELSDLSVQAETPLGPAELRLDGTAQPRDARLAADVTFQGVTPVAVFAGDLQAETNQLGLERLQTDLQITAEDQGLEGRLVADLVDLPLSPAGQLTVDLSAGPRAATFLTSLLAPAAQADLLTWQDLQLTLDLNGDFSDLTEETDWLSWLRAGDWSAAMTLTAQEVASEGRFEGGQLLLALDADQSDGTLRVLPAQTAELSVLRPDPAFLAPLGLPDSVERQLLAGIGLRLQTLVADSPLLSIDWGSDALALQPAFRIGLDAGESSAAAALQGNLEFDSRFDMQFIDLQQFNISASNWTLAGHRLQGAAISGRLSGPPDAVTGFADISAEGRPDLPDMTVETVAIHWPADLRGALPTPQLKLSGPLTLEAIAVANEAFTLAALDSRLTADLSLTSESLHLTAPGYLTAEDLRVGSHRIPELQTALDENELRWSADSDASHSAKARWSPLDLSGLDEAGALSDADLQLGLWQLSGALGAQGYSGTFVIEEAGVALQEPPLRIAGLRLEGSLPPQADTALELSGRLAHAADTPLFPPLDLAGSLTPEDDGYALAVTGRGLAGRLTALARATVDPERPRLRAYLTLAPLYFVPEGLQPGDLTPLLSDLTNASGRLAATLGLTWTPNGHASEGGVALEDLNFDYGDAVRVSGLSGGLDFDRLMPLQAPPPQRLWAARIETLFPLTDLTAEVGVATPEPNGSPRLEIVTARARALGGWLSLQQGLIDPTGNREEATLGLENIDLAELLAVLDTPDVQATGRISGEIPIRLEGDTVIVAGGRLAAEEPGNLRLTSEEAKQALAAGGESVDLMMRALENFQYRDLAITLDKPPEGETLVTLKLFGQNPAVLDGQPFDLNLSLETDLAPLLLALSQALALTDDTIEQLWRLQR